MKKFLITIFIYFTAFFASTIFANAASTGCAKTDDGTAILVKTGDTTPFALAGTTTYDKDACSQEPDEYKIKFFKVALCNADPYKGAADPDFSSCSDIFNEVGGSEKIIEPNTEVDLLEEALLLPVGSYPYMVVLVDNHLNVKHKQRYVLESDGTTAATIFGNTSGSGQWCYTIATATTYTGLDASAGSDNDHPIDYDTDQGLANNAVKKSGGSTSLAQLKCQSSEPGASDVVFATEIIDDLQDADSPDTADFEAFREYNSALEETGVAGIDMAQNLLLADNVSIATTPNNARRLLSHFKYASPVIISENTVGFKLRFSTFSSVSIDMSVDTSDNNKIYGAKVGGDPFMVQAQTKTKRARGDWR